MEQQTNRSDGGGSESVEALVGQVVAEPVRKTYWTRQEAESRKKGRLTVYLGAAPGVGKTYAMLSEGQRRKARGADVLVGFVETYGRPKTIEMTKGLEKARGRILPYRGGQFNEMNVEATIERRPQIALIDELAHTNIPGSRRAKRWEDVLDVLAEGINVITTVNIQHLASLNDVVAQTTGIRQQETVPDWVLDLADQLELVDMSPYALRRRMVHGNIYPDPNKAELALRRFFTEENLTALRELALMRVANVVDRELLENWSKKKAPETRERVMVCIGEGQEYEDLLRRAARMAGRLGGDLLVLHVQTSHKELDSDWAKQTQSLVRELGGEFHVQRAEDPVD
ncbi:MAG: hypothetical protein KY393_08170, partial [Actinobacteria bacterium]|nr:hypothetical protein [Actinomycetota bacterium]